MQSHIAENTRNAQRFFELKSTRNPGHAYPQAVGPQRTRVVPPPAITEQYGVDAGAYFRRYRDTIPDPMRVICLGGGVQSTALAYMAVEGQVSADLAVFADPQWESAGTYANLLVVQRVMEDAGYPCLFRSRGSLPEDLVRSAIEGTRVSQVPKQPSTSIGHALLSRRRWRG